MRHSGRANHRPYDHLGAMPRQSDQSDPHLHQYKVPLGDQGEPLSIDIKIRGLAGNQLLKTAPVGLSPWPEKISGTIHPAWSQMKLVHIIGAKRWFDSESLHHTLDLACSASSNLEEGRRKEKMRWLHVNQQKLNFDEFETIILSAPDLSRDWIIVLLSLLKRVRKYHHDDSTERFFPWMLRADSLELGLPNARKMTLSATTISVPYFAIGSMFGHGPRNTDHQYPIMSLFEWDNRFESAKEWDSEQSFRLMHDSAENKESIIYVPQVWAITFNDSRFLKIYPDGKSKITVVVIITYGQASFEELVDNESFKVFEIDPKTTERVTLIEVTDLRGHSFSLPMNKCQTFLVSTLLSILDVTH